MELTDMLKQYQLMVDTAQAASTSGKAPMLEQTVPLSITEARIEEITNQIADLSLQRAGVVGRYDAAIDERKAELDRLQKAASQQEMLLKGVAGSTETSTKAADTAAPSQDAGTVAPPKQAAAAPSPAAEVAIPAKKASTKVPPKRKKTKK